MSCRVVDGQWRSVEPKAAGDARAPTSESSPPQQPPRRAAASQARLADDPTRSHAPRRPSRAVRTHDGHPDRWALALASNRRLDRRRRARPPERRRSRRRASHAAPPQPRRLRLASCVRVSGPPGHGASERGFLCSWGTWECRNRSGRGGVNPGGNAPIFRSRRPVKGKLASNPRAGEQARRRRGAPPANDRRRDPSCSRREGQGVDPLGGL